MTTVIAGWEDDRKRSTSLAVLGVAIVVALGALALWWFVDAAPAWLYWVLVALLVLVLAFMAVMMLAKPKGAAMAPLEAPLESPTSPDPSSPAPSAATEPRILTLRCGDCGTIFDVNDTGERPLYHTCPGCGAEGALRDPVAVEAPPAEATPEPEAMYAMPPPAPAIAPVAAAAPAPVKRIKLRCGGCKEVFAIDDTGERPLRRACPHCGRMGQIQ